MSYYPKPLHRSPAMEWRNRLVVRLRDDGLTYRAIAEWFGVSKDRARQIDSAQRHEDAAAGRRAMLIAAYKRAGK